MKDTKPETQSYIQSNMKSETNSCPCGSEKILKTCCLPIIHGTENPSAAEELLRARYTAFTLGEIDFIISSNHSRTRSEIKRDEIEEWSKNSRWLGLKVAQIEAGKKDDSKGAIVFLAKYHAEGKDHDHWEKSYFEKENGSWKFVDAEGVKFGPYKREEPKIGRNDQCSCGSGKKFKKCCGK